MSAVVSQPGWVPISVYQREARLMVDWCFLGEERFVDPFFEQTVTRRMRNPFALLFRHQTPIETLEQLAPAARPSGFIFHMSRCGSTLVSQMLAAVPSNIVLSEAAPIDHVIRVGQYAPGASEEQHRAWLRGMVAALGRPRNPGERHVFVKFDSWHTFVLPYIRRAFPDVPWIFLYRDPVEVLVSHGHMPGVQMIPGLLDARTLGTDDAPPGEVPFDEYGARMLARICTAAADYVDSSALVIHYRQLPEIVTGRLLEFFRLRYSADALARMRLATRFHAKNPSFAFTDDTQEKRAQASERIRELAERIIRPAYERLEAINQAQFQHLHVS